MPVAPVPRNVALGKLYDVVSHMLHNRDGLLDLDQARWADRKRDFRQAGNVIYPSFRASYQ